MQVHLPPKTKLLPAEVLAYVDELKAQVKYIMPTKPLTQAECESLAKIAGGRTLAVTIDEYAIEIFVKSNAQICGCDFDDILSFAGYNAPTNSLAIKRNTY